MLADDFFTRIAKHLASGGIDLNIVPLQVDDHYGVRASLKNAAIECFPFSQLTVGFDPLGDVARYRQHMGSALVGELGRVSFHQQ